MKILVLGSRGLLGAAITRKLIEHEYPVSAPSHNELNILKVQDVIAHITTFKPTVTINCVGFHDISFCEEHEFETVAANVQAVRWLSAITKANNSRFFHFSTDQVLRFPPNLQNEDEKAFYHDIFSRTKRDSERVLESGQTAFRVSALYGYESGFSFVERIVGHVDRFQGEPIFLPDDIGCSPGYVEDIAEVMLRLVRQEGLPPIIHLTPEGMSGTYTWFQFAWDIIEIYVNRGSLIPAKYLTPKETHRPPTGIVNMTTKYGWRLPPVKDSLKRYFEMRKNVSAAGVQRGRVYPKV